MTPDANQIDFDTPAQMTAKDDTSRPPPDRTLSPTLQLAANIWMLLLVGYLVVLPAGLLHIGIPLFALTGFVGGLIWLYRIKTVVSDVRLVIVGFAFAGALPVLVGVMNSTPGWRDVAVPLVAGPVLWYLASQLADLGGIRLIPVAVGIGTIGVAAVILSLVTGTGVEVVQFVMPNAYGFSVEGEVRANYAGVSALIATVPFLTVLVVDHYRLDATLRRGKFLVFASLIGLAASLLSGRQGVVGAVALIPVLMLVTTALGFARPQGRTRSASPWRILAVGMLLLGGGVVAATAVGVDATRLPGDLLSSVGLADGGNERVQRGSDVRGAQSASLIEGWRGQPWLGGGAGVVAPDFYTWRGYELGRDFNSTPRPWRAELSYHLFLFEAGLLGVGAYLIAFGFAIRRLLRRYPLLEARDQVLCRAAIVSAFSIALATAANPIARAIGHQWTFFLPVLIIAAATQRGSEAATSPENQETTSVELRPETASPT